MTARLHVAAIALAVAVAAASPVAAAQGNDSKIESLRQAVTNTPQAIQDIRTLTKLNRVEIVYIDRFVVDDDDVKVIDNTVDDNEKPVSDLRNAIQANAVVYAALDDRNVGVPSIVAANVETTDDGKRLTVFVQRKHD